MGALLRVNRGCMKLTTLKGSFLNIKQNGHEAGQYKGSFVKGIADEA